MTILEMLQQSVVLSILGMAVVFAFLTIMVIVINLVGKLLSKKDMATLENKPVNNEKTVTPEIIAVISTAISEYKKGTK